MTEERTETAENSDKPTLAAGESDSAEKNAEPTFSSQETVANSLRPLSQFLLGNYSSLENSNGDSLATRILISAGAESVTVDSSSPSDSSVLLSHQTPLESTEDSDFIRVDFTNDSIRTTSSADGHHFPPACHFARPLTDPNGLENGTAEEEISEAWEPIFERINYPLDDVTPKWGTKEKSAPEIELEKPVDSPAVVVAMAESDDKRPIPRQTVTITEAADDFSDEADLSPLSSSQGFFDDDSARRRFGLFHRFLALIRR